MAWNVVDNLKGDSAYEVAVQNGFVGTEPEWLASLQGEGAVDLDAHVNDPDPHPAYDTIPSLVLLFENHLI